MVEREETGDDELAEESITRATILEALLAGPLDSGELDERVPMSRSTIHRATRSLGRSGVLAKNDDGFELTGFGAVLAEETRRYRSNVATARELDEFLNVVSTEDVDIPLEHFADAEILRPRPRQAHFGVDRIIDLIQESDSLRLFTSIISPLYVKVAHREMVNGMDIEAIFDTSVVDIILSKYVDEAIESLESGHFSVHVADDVPFELFIYDHTMAIAAHDESALPRMFVETDAPEAIRWAEDLYRTYEERAWEFDLERLPPRPNTGASD